LLLLILFLVSLHSFLFLYTEHTLISIHILIKFLLPSYLSTLRQQAP
jgi:hypothetical protein